ncbi:MAG: sigma-70 family RNA polymerase sigma factor [Planctomycetota bacterium]|nr:sigma-70 family RNA polymerase sigma factor [Planctomycetota bacterium]MDP6764369.1 sigma-70 family RNA polymerase sigma factor [Planctomycetota bacterium]MDP6989997.1 sigma-70 family RNA polymerase sigma factor [Planctomycetota bacterium]
MKGSATPAKGPDAMVIEATRLMLATREGDHGAFDDLVGRLRGRAFAVAHSLVGSPEDAHDMTQETFMKVYRARETFREGEAFLPWFHRILRNTCFSFLRKRGRLRKVSLSAGAEDEGDFELADPDAPAPSARAEADERTTAFRAAFETLTARDREVITLRHFEELSYRSIAESLDIPQGTVMSRLFHARRRLREKLGDALGETPSPDATDRR